MGLQFGCSGGFRFPSGLVIMCCVDADCVWLRVRLPVVVWVCGGGWFG